MRNFPSSLQGNHLSTSHRTRQLFQAVRRAPLGQLVGEVFGMVVGRHGRPKTLSRKISDHKPASLSGEENGRLIRLELAHEPEEPAAVLDLGGIHGFQALEAERLHVEAGEDAPIGRASCRERV